jgi:hypothetical protein
MSFQSGFNSGVGITDSLRQSANRRATLDQQAKRDAVTAGVQDLQAERISYDLKQKQTVDERLQADRLASNIVLSKYVKDIDPLDPSNPEDFKKYSKYSAAARSVIRSPEVLESFSLIDQNFKYAAEANGLLQLKNTKIADKLLFLKDLKELSDRGNPVEGNLENQQAFVQEYRNWKQVQKMLGGNITGESMGLDHNLPFVSNEELPEITKKIRILGAERYARNQMSPDQRQKAQAREHVENAKGSGFMAVVAASSRGTTAPAAIQKEIQQSFNSLSLSVDAQVAMKSLEIPTGKLFGPWVASLKEVFGADENIAAFKSSITRLVPSLARGQFGEVGVLTDTDVARYMQTVASLEQSPNANKIAMEATKVLLAKSLRDKIHREALAGNNVSQFAPQLKRIANIPTTLYMSKNDAETMIYDDIVTGHVVPGDVIAVWDGVGAFSRSIAQTQEFYDED